MGSWLGGHTPSTGKNRPSPGTCPAGPNAGYCPARQTLRLWGCPLTERNLRIFPERNELVCVELDRARESGSPNNGHRQLVRLCLPAMLKGRAVTFCCS